MSTEIITCLIVQAVVLIGYILTFVSQKRKDRNAMEQLRIEQTNTQEEKLENLKKEIQKTLNEHREEYIGKINSVNDSITDIKAAYQETSTTFTLQIEELSRRVEKHNNVIERTYALERDVAVLSQKEKSSEARIKCLERDVNKQ